MIQITIIIILFVVVLIGFTAMLKHTNRSKDYILIPKKIKLSELKSQLTKLKNRDTAYPFIGITSNGTDCIYFTYKNGSFNIEFEAILENQVPYIDKLKGYANSQNINTQETTYNNQPKYKSEKPAIVLRIEANSDIDKIAKIGEAIQLQVFENNQETLYEVVS